MKEVKKVQKKYGILTRNNCEKSNSFETDKNKPKQSASNSILLPKVCIFCNNDVKYKNREPKPLRKCEVKQVKEFLENCTKKKNDYRVISLVSTRDMIVLAEAKYHHSCYAHYTA